MRSRTDTARASSVLRGSVAHVRRSPVRHAFRYPVVSYLLDLDELPALDHELAPLFGLAGAARRPVTFDPARYLVTEDGAGVRDRLRALLARTPGAEVALDRVLLLTNLAVAGYAFNPISLWFCHDAAGVLQSVVLEVGNTYGEEHPYVLQRARDARADGSWHATLDKRFHVSPFHGLDMTYDVQVAPPRLDAPRSRSGAGEPVRLVVRAAPGDGAAPFTAVLEGTREPLTRASLARAQLRYPLFPQRVIALIHLQALRLWLKRVPFRRKPDWVPRRGSLAAPTDELGLEPR